LVVFFHPSGNRQERMNELLRKIQRTIVRHFGITPDYLIPLDKNSFPKTSIGKIQRPLLLQRFQAGEFDALCRRTEDYHSPLDTNYVSPRTPIEQGLANIWSDVLRLGKVGIHDNFLDIGGDSLAAAQIIARVITSFQLELPLRALLQSPTIAQMTAVIREYQAKQLGQGELDHLLDELESITDEEAQRLLLQDSKSK